MLVTLLTRTYRTYVYVYHAVCSLAYVSVSNIYVRLFQLSN